MSGTDTDISPRMGFIGLGNIGAPMAQHLLGWPGGLVVRDLDESATAPFADGGATVATSATEVAEQCDVISVMVLDDAQVRLVVGEVLASARPGTVIAIHSTIHAETAGDLAADARGRGVEVVDAAVSGGFMGAHEARLAVMVGGSPAAFARLEEPFARFADLVLHMGPVGAGTKAKLARNLVTFVSYAAAGEAARLAEASGIAVQDLARVVRHSDAVTGGPGAILIRETAGPMDRDDAWRPTLEHTRDLGEKDLTFALELASAEGVDVPLATLALNRLGGELGL